MRQNARRSVYLWGSAASLRLLPVTLGRCGKLMGDGEEPDLWWRWDGGQLQLLDETRRVVARLMVNTIPKAGTYLLDLLLREMGYHGIGLHLIPRECHDNRQVAPAEMHRDPFSRRIYAPATAVTRLMAAGEFAVGHVDDPAALRAMAADGVGLIHCQRDLRDVLVSLYRFKRDKVNPVSAADQAWRRVEGSAGFVAFLCAYAGSEIADLCRFAHVLPRAPGVLLRYEDLALGLIPPAAMAGLEAIEPGLGVLLRELLPHCWGAATPTQSGARSEWRDYWSGAAEEFFTRAGLAAANRDLGYG